MGPSVRWSLALVRTSAVLVCAALACAACGDDGGAGGGGGTGGSGAAGGGGSTNVTPPTGTGVEVVDRLGAAAAACGVQTVGTVPGGWDSVAIADLGCNAWVPGGWTVQGEGTPSVTMFADQSGTEGALAIAGATNELATCSPVEARDGVLGGFTDGGFTAPEILWHAEVTESFGGSDWDTAHAVFSTSFGGTPLVGYLWVLTAPTVIACDVVALGFWEPESAIERDTCTVLQVLNSVTCPSGGGCDEADCNDSCVNEGFSGGSCGDGCECY